MTTWTTIKEKRELVFPAAYLIVIAIGMFFALPMEHDNSNSFFFLILMTLPWSIVSFLVIMSAIHQGFPNEAGLVLFSFTAIVNAILLYLISKKLSKT